MFRDYQGRLIDDVLLNKFSFTMDCGTYTNYADQFVNDIELIIECVEKISNDDMLYIYDVDWQCQFVIEIYQGNYSLSLMNFFRSFTKGDLIAYLREGFSIFKEIAKDPESCGFVWEDDGGL